MVVLTLFERGGSLYTPDALLYRVGDVLNALILCYAGFRGLQTWRFFRDRSADALYWLLAGAGMVYLAIDELLSLHEFVGRELWEHGWNAPQPFTQNDDAILFMLALGGVSVTALFFRALLEHRSPALLLLAGMTATGLVILMELWTIATVVEESTELTAAVILALAFTARVRVPTALALEPEPLPASGLGSPADVPLPADGT